MGRSVGGSQWVPTDVDLDSPNAARVYDYYLGGGHNFDVDRAFGDRIKALVPEVEHAARLNRRFLHRAVRYLAGQGITQFLDIGSGIPTVGHVHEIAQAVDPDARVVYVDSEPVAVAHAQLLLEDVPGADVLEADLRDPGAVLGSAPVRDLLDLTRPTALLLVAVLHFVPGDPAPVVARYVDALAPGSALVLSHATPDPDPERFGRAAALYQNANTPFVVRSYDEIVEFFAGTDLLPPGVVWTAQWRPEPGDDDDAASSAFYAGVGIKPGGRTAVLLAEPHHVHSRRQ